MAQIPPPGLPPELTGTQGPAPVAPGGPTGPGGPSIREAMGPLVQSPADDFIHELMSIADELGIVDEVFQEETVGDQVDTLDVKADPMEFLSKQQLTTLVQKFLAIQEPERSRIGAELKKQLPPQVAQRLDAIVRMVIGEAR